MSPDACVPWDLLGMGVAVTEILMLRSGNYASLLAQGVHVI